MRVNDAHKVFSWFRVHPRKCVGALPDVDWVGRRFPSTLSEVYAAYSDAKGSAYADCRDIFDTLNGHKFRISSHSTFSFVVEFEFAHPDTGDAMVARITRDHMDAWFIG